MTKQININHLRINDERIKQYVDAETAKAGKHEIVNSAGTALPPEPNIRFNGLDATDNAQDATSEISAKGLNADDLAEIVSTTPANYAVGNTAMYSTTEQIVGRWIDGKPLYRRVIEIPEVQAVDRNWTLLLTDPTFLNTIDKLISAKFLTPIGTHLPLDTKIQDGKFYLWVSPGGDRINTIIIEYTKTGGA